MPDKILLKRSSVVGVVPRTSSLDIGELGLNTADGKAYFRKSGSAGDVITSFVVANSTTTGSIALIGTGSFDHIVVTGSLIQGPNLASGLVSHAEGSNTTASGNYSHAEGNSTTASGDFSHAEGNYTVASGLQSHAEGLGARATYIGAHAEGGETVASGHASHAEGIFTSASGYAAHAEGWGTSAAGTGSHAEGNSTLASGNYSHAEGIGTTASADYQHVEGTYNVTSSTAIWILGQGLSIGDRKNLITAYRNNLEISGALNITGALHVTGTIFAPLINVTGSTLITGSLHMSYPSGTLPAQTNSINIFGTASNAISASRAIYAENGGAPIVRNSIPDSASISGSLWWNTDDGNLYVQIAEPSGTTWVPATSTVAGGNYGATSEFTYASATTWSIQHNFGTVTPIVQVYTGSQMMVPASIRAVDSQSLEILFSAATAGTAKVSTGVGGPTSASFATSTATAQTASFAQTASYLTGQQQATYLTAVASGGQLIEPAGNTLTNFTNYTAINAGEWNATTGYFTATKAGTYLVNAQVKFASASFTAGQRLSISIIYNNSTSPARGYANIPVTATQFGPSVSATGIVRLSIGDFIRFSAISEQSVRLDYDGSYITIQELPTGIQR